MDWQDSLEQAQFRTEVAEFIQTRLPDRYRSGDDNNDETQTTGWQADRKSNDASAKEIPHRALGPVGFSASDKTQSYSFLINFIQLIIIEYSY